MFGGGATGFSFFIDSCIDDPAKMLALATAVQYAVHFEDHFLKGFPLLPGIDVDTSEGTENNVRVWSGMRLASSTWMVVTAVDPTKPASLVLHVTEEKAPYTMCDLSTGVAVSIGPGPVLHVVFPAAGVASVASVVHVSTDATSTCTQYRLPPDAWLPREQLP